VPTARWYADKDKRPQGAARYRRGQRFLLLKNERDGRARFSPGAARQAETEGCKAMIAQPNPDTVRNVAFLFSALATDNQPDAFNKLRVALVDGMMALGWSQEDAEAFADEFARGVASSMAGMPRDGTRH
jgi:hypothetical protein